MSENDMNKRIISRVDIKNSTLVKGVQFEGLRTLGDPCDFAEYYYNEGVDEIFLMDVVASLYERNSLGNIIKDISAEVFVPITVGGGIRSLKDIHDMLESGADKVSINTAAIKNPEFFIAAVKEFGSSTIVANIEVAKNEEGFYECFYDNGREPAGVNLCEWVQYCLDVGVGEISISSVLDDGMGKGFDTGILDSLTMVIDVPLIVHGGIGSIKDVKELCKNEKVDGVAIASALHYEALTKMTITNNEGNYLYAKSGRVPKNIFPFKLNEIRKKV